MPDHVLALLIGLVLDLLLGDPAWLYHPVCLIGKYIAFEEKRLRARSGDLRIGAVRLAVSTVLLTMAVCAGILAMIGLCGRVPRLIFMIILNWLGLAVTSMAREAHGVADALEIGVEAGRARVARIVGRDTRQLSEDEIVKATIETVAENTTDGVISPMFWSFLGGPVLLWGFKAVSTLDSMVGYLDDRYRDIGWAGARSDDVMNYLPARLTALLMCAGAVVCRLDARNALRIVRRDHAEHLSPNCAWSEAAAAGALHVRLGGAHEYFGKVVAKPTIGDDDRPVCRDDIGKTVMLLYATAALMAAILSAIGVLL